MDTHYPLPHLVANDGVRIPVWSDTIPFEKKYDVVLSLVCFCTVLRSMDAFNDSRKHFESRQFIGRPSNHTTSTFVL